MSSNISTCHTPCSAPGRKGFQPAQLGAKWRRKKIWLFRGFLFSSSIAKYKTPPFPPNSVLKRTCSKYRCKTRGIILILYPLEGHILEWNQQVFWQAPKISSKLLTIWLFFYKSKIECDIKAKPLYFKLVVHSPILDAPKYSFLRLFKSVLFFFSFLYNRSKSPNLEWQIIMLSITFLFWLRAYQVTWKRS